MITKGELVRATVTWKQAHFGAVMSGLLQLPHKGTRGIGVLQRESLPPQPPTLLHLRYPVWSTSRGISIPTITPFGTINVHSKTDV